MTARVCPVHGEYAADGVCRWCDADETPAQELARINADVIGEAPGVSALRDVKCIAEMLGDPHPRWDPAPTFTYAGEDASAVHWILDFTPAICPEDLTAAFDAEVAAEHAALRWERVARRWAAKGQTPPLHRMTLEGEIAFDDHCATCRQVRDKLIRAWFPKEWP